MLTTDRYISGILYASLVTHHYAYATIKTTPPIHDHRRAALPPKPPPLLHWSSNCVKCSIHCAANSPAGN